MDAVWLYSFFFLLSFFLLSFFLRIPLSRQNLRSLLLRGNKRDRTQCTEWSQFVADYFFGSVTYFTGV